MAAPRQQLFSIHPEAAHHPPLLGQVSTKEAQEHRKIRVYLQVHIHLVRVPIAPACSEVITYSAAKSLPLYPFSLTTRIKLSRTTPFHPIKTVRTSTPPMSKVLNLVMITFKRTPLHPCVIKALAPTEEHGTREELDRRRWLAPSGSISHDRILLSDIGEHKVQRLFVFFRILFFDLSYRHAINDSWINLLSS